jgi:hypothetical protein
MGAEPLRPAITLYLYLYDEGSHIIEWFIGSLAYRIALAARSMNGTRHATLEMGHVL